MESDAEKIGDRNWRDKDGRLFVLYCPKCGKENWAPAVASGLCAWCGWKEDPPPAELAELTAKDEPGEK